ncbi:DUF58 domain-containing protein [Nocardioides jishulii]|uniref:DUF58 domain-containing protein n=1 Tax=Nocardioides jishulii TaxID=2575440 RepID=A0A4U2YTB0_9ACTN|nr:DUF58 domain-containing protein [Nocardioides jishulii]QCX28428.1 DUF58 domain-containing protein [Nocardioides jishulii]TKI64679.1 DUF58 domain-containing protein [Nocardioides jishulii]
MTLTGRVPLLLLLGLVPVVLRPDALTVWLWLALVAVLVAVDVALAPSPDALEVVRRPVEPARHGAPTSTTLVVTHRGHRKARGLLRDAWQPTAGDAENRHRLRLAPQERVLLTTDLLPTRRGTLRALGVTVRLLGPLGLAARQRTYAVPGELRSLPRFDSRKHLPSRLARLRDLDGRSAVRVRGAGTEFDSLRDYVRGDDVRSIDWRASSRARNVVVRTWQPERDRRVVLVLDTSRTSAARIDDVPRLDAAMEAAQLLAALASRAGDRVDMVAGDRVVRRRLRTSGPGAVGEVARALTDVHPEIVEADWRSLASAVTQLGRHRALLVLLTPLEPSAVELGLLPVLGPLTRHHRVVVASVRDPELVRTARQADDAESVWAAVAAEQVLARRTHTERMLRALGVDVLDVDAEHLAPALADHYLSLKARGLL